MKTTIFFWGLVLACLISACGKRDNGSGTGSGGGGTTINNPKIISFLPAIVTTGTTVTLTGEYFGTDISKITLKLDNNAITISSVTSQSIVFTVPLNLIAGGSKIFNMQVFVDGLASNIIPITVEFEAHGWFYIKKNISIPNNRIPLNMYFFDDKSGVMSGRLLFNNSSDSGKNWGGIMPSNYLGSGFHVYNDTLAWIEANNYDVVKYNHTSTSSFARLDTITTIPRLGNEFISGLFITRPGHGYVLTHEGCIFKINGSFSPSNISQEYQSSYYTSLPTSTVGDFDQISGIDSMNFMVFARPKVNNVIVPIIIHKKNGVYTEYNLSSLLAPGWVYRLQYVDANSAYFISLDYDMYKFNFTNNTWSKLATPTKFASFIFLNGNVGYASTGFIPGQTTRKVYKTIDGGITWTDEFTLDNFFYAYTMATKNNKLWIYGESGANNFFLLKYNP